MKIIQNAFVAISLLLTWNSAQAQASTEKEAKTPNMQPVAAFEFSEIPKSEYSNLSSYWQSVAEANGSDQNAWLNFYKAEKYGSYTEHSRSAGKEQQARLDEIITRMSMAIPNTFALHYARYLNGNKSDDAFIHLREAHLLNPENAELYDDMLCDAVIRRNQNAIVNFADKLSKTGIYNSAEVEYNRNVLNSIEQGGLLITYGNVDTYPIIMMQELQSFRKDIKVICLEWLASNTYNKTIASQTGITGEVTFEKLLQAGSQVYVALTVPPDMIRKHSTRLYCTGLAMKYSKTQIKNLESLVYNWENLFSKDRMQSADQINRNYLLPLILIRDYYIQNGGQPAAEEIQRLAGDIAVRFGTTKAIKKHLD